MYNIGEIRMHELNNELEHVYACIAEPYKFHEIYVLIGAIFAHGEHYGIRTPLEGFYREFGLSPTIPTRKGKVEAKLSTGVIDTVSINNPDIVSVYHNDVEYPIGQFTHSLTDRDLKINYIYGLTICHLAMTSFNQTSSDNILVLPEGYCDRLEDILTVGELYDSLIVSETLKQLELKMISLRKSYPYNLIRLQFNDIPQLTMIEVLEHYKVFDNV